MKRIEQNLKPTSCIIFQENVEQSLSTVKMNHIFISNSDYKIRILNSDTLFVRKTTLGPGALYGTITK